ncbi:phosphotransferase family protein [Algoriphagus hitonicola]|uniref:Predicted kinase, aminoglycoside phosphotransferase (APT) family n=1 Tax=Algoriphagus hitonicola TaxID=435880 RepID=A0A1I2X948_9BACT|nr:phosphotransferase family protein [Algoriphagus hitonicola]SFH10043.1 Predicted kinase, aminoglycoside phosphotransferase (APT) family [Algoriphagus hitonicola]
MNTELPIEPLKSRLKEQLDWDPDHIEIKPLSGGYSNLTFLLISGQQKLALRRPPHGYKISTAHDMVREYKVLQSLEKAAYSKSPKPIYLDENEAIVGAPFFIMEFIEGKILRPQSSLAKELKPAQFQSLSIQFLDSLLELHQLDLQQSGLIKLGKPEGYVERQVSGWSNRYKNAKTQPIGEMEKTSDWLLKNLPKSSATAFIHNDYKYDNLVLQTDPSLQIKSVLDWEMATVGDPLMDLGTSLAYWAEADDPAILKQFNASYLPGNLSRSEIIAYYEKTSGFSTENMLFYYVFGLFKVGVIAQQIFKRFQLGQAKDPRFAALIEVVKAAGKLAESSIQSEKI